MMIVRRMIVLHLLRWMVSNQHPGVKYVLSIRKAASFQIVILNMLHGLFIAISILCQLLAVLLRIMVAVFDFAVVRL